GKTFAHARSTRDDDQIRRLEARGQVVEIVEAARDAGDGLLLLVESLDRLQRFHEKVGDADELRLHLAVGDAEDELLGTVEHLADVLAALVAVDRKSTRLNSSHQII